MLYFTPKLNIFVLSPSICKFYWFALYIFFINKTSVTSYTSAESTTIGKKAYLHKNVPWKHILFHFFLFVLVLIYKYFSFSGVLCLLTSLKFGFFCLFVCVCFVTTQSVPILNMESIIITFHTKLYWSRLKAISYSLYLLHIYIASILFSLYCSSYSQKHLPMVMCMFSLNPHQKLKNNLKIHGFKGKKGENKRKIFSELLNKQWCQKSLSRK